jgi:hypothetical protein
MLSLYGIRYTPMGYPMGLDINTVIELVKLMKDPHPIDTIEKVMFLSNELIKKDAD